MEEWETVRRAAAQEINTVNQCLLEQDTVNTLGATGDRRRPFLLSTVLQKRLTARYRMYSRGSFAAFLAVGCAVAWLINIRP